MWLVPDSVADVVRPVNEFPLLLVLQNIVVAVGRC